MKDIFSIISSFLFSLISLTKKSELLFEFELFMLEIISRLFNNKEFDFSLFIAYSENIRLLDILLSELLKDSCDIFSLDILILILTSLFKLS